ACHGDSGEGDGPQSASLASPPADLEIHVPLHTDSDLFAFIRDGIPGTAMPAQKGILGDEDMWHLVNFLRTMENP
ncbi:MAG: cytochrome c, partial [Chloroflexi bacterium]|nr:cytochrome c [Chloroflexota bacterium]